MIAEGPQPGAPQENPVAPDERERLIADFERQLLSLKPQKLQIAKTEDQVGKAYAPLESIIEQLKSRYDFPGIKELELRMLRQQYAHTRKAYLERMSWVENRNTGKAEWDTLITELFDDKIFPYLERHKDRIVQLQDDPDAADEVKAEIAEYQADYDNLFADYGRRRRGHFVRIFNSDNIVWGKDRKRVPVESLNNEMVYFGADVQGIIREGIMDPEFEGHFTNLVLGERTVDLRKGSLKRGMAERGKHRTVKEGRKTLERVTFNETATGWCMRAFDNILLGFDKNAKDSSGEKMTTRNLYKNADDLIDYVHDKLLEEIIDRGSLPELEEVNGADDDATRALRKEAATKRLDRTYVERVFYVYAQATLNHSYLAEDSSFLEDNFFYLFNWLDYCIKYSKAGTGSFNALVTYLLFGYGEGIFETLFGKHEMAEMTHKLKRKNLWEGNRHLVKALGIDGFRKIVEEPMINVQDVAQGKSPDGKTRVKKPIFSPPLRYFILKDNKGKAVKYPETAGKKGRYVSFDDLQTTDGERLYELMPFSQVGEGYVEYFTQLSKNGMGLLKLALKAPENEFLSQLDTPDFANTLRNQGKYSMTLFPNVGSKIRENESVEFLEDGPDGQERVLAKHPVGNIVMNETIIRLVIAKCLIQSDPAKEKNRWTMQEVRDYLDEMARQGALGGTSEIGYEVAEGIEIIIEEGRKWSLRFADLSHALQQQIEEQAKIH